LLKIYFLTFCRSLEDKSLISGLSKIYMSFLVYLDFDDTFCKHNMEINDWL